MEAHGLAVVSLGMACMMAGSLWPGNRERWWNHNPWVVIADLLVLLGVAWVLVGLAVRFGPPRL